MPHSRVSQSSTDVASARRPATTINLLPEGPEGPGRAVAIRRAPISLDPCALLSGLARKFVGGQVHAVGSLR
jgi:hypothetical protein